MMVKRIPVEIFSAALLLVVLASPAWSMDKATYHFWEVVDCPNEPIEMLGSVRFQFQETGKGWVYQAFWTGEGFGLDTDADYRIQGKWQEVVQAQRPYVFYWNDHFELVGKRGAPTYRFYSKIRFDEFDPDIGPVPDSIRFEDGEWPCETVAYDIWPAD